MACRMPAKGEQVTLLVADGNKTFAELLAEAKRHLTDNDYWKIDATLEFQENLLSLAIDGEREGLVAVCLETSNEKTITGDRALEDLRSLLKKVPMRGFLEVYRLTRAGIKLDLQEAPETKLSRHMDISELLEEKIKTEGRKRQTKQEEAIRADSRLKKSHKILNSSLEDKITGEGRLTVEEVTKLLTDLIFFSSTIRLSRDYRSLTQEAINKSKMENNSFYRINIERRDDIIINLFVYRGRICSALIIDPNKGIGELRPGDIVKLEETIDSVGVESARLDVVRCSKCMNVFVGPCLGEETRINKGKDESREEKRGGLLSRLFRRGR